MDINIKGAKYNYTIRAHICTFKCRVRNWTMVQLCKIKLRGHFTSILHIRAVHECDDLSHGSRGLTRHTGDSFQKEDSLQPLPLADLGISG